MDRSNDFVLKLKNRVVENGSSGYWENILAALGDSRTVERFEKSLSLEELSKGAMSDLSVSPSIVELRIEALSVCGKSFLSDLYEQLNSHQDTNPFVDAAKRTLNKIISPPELDIQGESWEWSSCIDIHPQEAFELCKRPLAESALYTEDLIQASRSGGALRALRNQDVNLDQVDFSHWVKSIENYDPWVLALIIELSRRVNFPMKDWYSAFDHLVSVADDARDLIPSSYTLISLSWCTP